MPVLNLTLEPKARETLPSFLSRLAAANGLGVVEFSKDMGFSFKRVLNFEEVALQTLAEVAGLRAEQLGELVSWTGRPAGDIRMQFRGELVPSRTLRSPVVRGCPDCLRADIAAQSVAPLTAMTYRGEWQLKDAKVCVTHNRPLVPLWEEDTPLRRWDFQAGFSDLQATLRAAQAEETPFIVTAYDLWLDRRLRTGEDETWFKGHTVFAAARLCKHIGQQIIDHGFVSRDLPVEAGRPEAIGFSALNEGPTALRSTLDDLVAVASGAGDGPKKAFGALYAVLNRDYADAPEFDGFRDIMRACILDHWPFAAGDVVLGQVVEKRKLHSVASAADEVGIGDELLDRILTENRAFAVGDQRPPARKTFDADRFQDVLCEIPNWVGPTAICATLGATKAQFQRLVEHGVLTPTVKDPKVKARWQKGQAQNLRDALLKAAVNVARGDQGWVSLHVAGGQDQGGLKRVIDGVFDGTVALGYLPEQRGYRSLVVPKSIVAVIDQRKTNVEPVTAVAFARSIGLRQKGAFLAFIQDGHTPATLMKNATTGQAVYRMTEKDIAAFRSLFCSYSITVPTSGHSKPNHV